MYCCGDEDCGLIDEITVLSNGDLLITITTLTQEKRTAIFPKSHTITPSPDDKNHACIFKNLQPRCLFLRGMV